MKFEKYVLKDPIEKIFKEILDNLEKKIYIKKIFKLADDYSNYIILNPSTTPEILFEEEYEREISECPEKDFVMYGNLEYGNKNLHYLKVLISKQSVCEVYGYENFDENKFYLNVKYKELETQHSGSEICDIVKGIIKNYTLFKF